jgi:hypothetical protein
VFTILTSLTVFSGFTQNKEVKKRLIEEPVLYKLLDDNFKKDGLLKIYEKENTLQDSLIEMYKEKETIQELRIEKLKSIVINTESQRSLLEQNNTVLTESNYNLNLFLDRSKKEVESLTGRNKRKRKWIVGFVAENVLILATTIVYIKLK